MIELIVTDLDKTLLNDKKEVTKHTAEVLRGIQLYGIKVAFATARPERATEGFQHSFKPDFIISDNGANISYEGKVIYNNFIPIETSDALIASLIAMDDVSRLTAEAGSCMYANFEGEPGDAENWNLVYDDFSRPLNLLMTKLSVEFKDISLIKELLAQYPELHLYGNSGEYWCQIMHVNSTKMRAINHISEKFGIAVENIVAFGDDFNDVEMIRQCGKGVAAGNAIGEVKAAADFVCGCNNEDGVARWLEANL